MTKRLKPEQNSAPLPATVSRLKPGDFPVGSVQSRAAARALLDGYAAEQARARADEFVNLTPYQRAFAEGEEDPETARWLIALALTTEERAKVFGITLQTPEEICYLKKVGKLANEISGGQYTKLLLSDSMEANRIRDLAEQRLKAEGVRRED